MIAVAASILFTLYLLVPSSIFRLVFGLFVPLKNFVRTRGEEILQGVLSTLLPIIFALIFVWNVPPFKEHPFNFPDTTQSRRADYRLVTGTMYSEALFKENSDAFWKALTRTGRRQGRFIAWYYLLIIFEGVLFGWLSVSYPMFSNKRWYQWLATHVLLPNISAWHLLLTPFFFEDKGTLVRADILCSDNTLYRGIVASYELGTKGELVGIVITEARRFARADLLKDREKGKVNTDDYWHAIPGRRFYIVGDKIFNLNLSYIEPPSAQVKTEQNISKQLKQPITLTVETQVSVKPQSGTPQK
ncbi:MAG: hypothetical protein WBL70_13050 [Candidatus Acidiferrales bacterium]